MNWPPSTINLSNFSGSYPLKHYIIFLTHLKLCLATASHNFKCVNIKPNSYFFNLRLIICKSLCLSTHLIPDDCNLIGIGNKLAITLVWLTL